MGVCRLHISVAVCGAFFNALYGLPGAARETSILLEGGSPCKNSSITWGQDRSTKTELSKKHSAVKRKLGKLGFDHNEAGASITFAGAESDSSSMALLTLVDKLAGRRGID